MSMVHEPLRYAHDQGHTDVVFAEDGCKFITCGADGDIRIWSTDESEDPINNCVGEWSTSIAVKSDKIYVSTDNNDVRILSLENGERAGILDRSTAPINQIVPDKDTGLIALANEEKQIKLLDLDNPDKEVVIFDGLKGPCLSVSLSSKSNLLAATSGDGKLRIWNLDRDLLHTIDCCPITNSFSNAKIFCRVDFEPNYGKQLIYPHNNTVIVLDVSDYSNRFVLKHDDVDSNYSIVKYSPCGKFILATSENGDFIIWSGSTGDLISSSKHEGSLSICGVAWNPLGNGQIIYTDIEGQLGVIDWNYKLNDDKTEEKVFNDAPIDDINDDEDEENVFSLSKLKEKYMPDLDQETKNSDIEASSRSSTPRPRSPETILQPPFQPSSTPEHLDPRYMCWNSVGVIRCYGHINETSSKSIEVEFHDSDFHHSMMMQNYHDYTMGVVSKTALLVANATQMQVVPLGSASKEWTLKMDENEEITSISASEKMICFATSSYLIRIATIYGTQIGVVSVPGPVIAMSAYKNTVMVAYHASAPIKGDQNINIKLYKIRGFELECKDIGSALGPKTTLFWLGFSDLGTPGMMDSNGMVSMYPEKFNAWIPFCDTMKNRANLSDGYFITIIQESLQTIGGIRCKGTVYPGFIPRPVMCELPIEPPFVESSNDKTKMETSLFTWSVLRVPNIERKFKETAIKTFALACKNNLDERALELMEILENPQITNLALKYATKLDKRRLSEKLTEFLSKLNEETEIEPEPKHVIEKVVNSKSTNKKLSINTSKRKYTSEYSQDVIEDSQNSVVDVTGCTFNESVTNSMIEAMNDEETPTNPFTKKFKSDTKSKSDNPLSLTDKYAGVNYEFESKENKMNNEKTVENDKPKQKQQKIDLSKFKRTIK